MMYFWILVIFLFGASLGSFILVIADRYNTGLKFFKGRSFCFSCNTQLKRDDLMPIFSFLFLKGKCRYCQSKIPISAFLTEISMGFLSVVLAFKSGFLEGLELRAWSLEESLIYLLLIAIFGIILLISLYDLRHFIIPDSFLVAFFVFSLIFNISTFQSFNILLSHLASGLIISLPFLLLFLFSQGRWLGFGDIKYIFVIGFFLGFIQGVSAVIVAFWIGAIFALMLFILKKLHFRLPMFKNGLTIKSEIPFGPFLSLGILLSFLFDLDIFQINLIIETLFN